MRQMSTEHFATRHGITLKAEPTDHNPHMPDSDMDHWRVTLRNGKRTMTLPFSMGSAYNGNPPTAAQVLDCLASDSANVQGAFFEDWASDYGMSTDSKKAERTFAACQRNADHLERLLGERDYTLLLYKVARS